MGLRSKICRLDQNRVLIAALLYGDEDINVATSITLYKAFTGNYPDFDKL